MGGAAEGGKVATLPARGKGKGMGNGRAEQARGKGRDVKNGEVGKGVGAVEGMDMDPTTTNVDAAATVVGGQEHPAVQGMNHPSHPVTADEPTITATTITRNAATTTMISPADKVLTEILEGGPNQYVPLLSHCIFSTRYHFE